MPAGPERHDSPPISFGRRLGRQTRQGRRPSSTWVTEGPAGAATRDPRPHPAHPRIPHPARDKARELRRGRPRSSRTPCTPGTGAYVSASPTPPSVAQRPGPPPARGGRHPASFGRSLVPVGNAFLGGVRILRLPLMLPQRHVWSEPYRSLQAGAAGESTSFPVPSARLRWSGLDLNSGASPCLIDTRLTPDLPSPGWREGRP